MNRLRSLALTLFAALVVAAPAHAAAPIALGPGTSPSLVVDPGGTGHMVFRSTPDDGIVYCRLPRKARACDVRTALPIGGTALSYKLLRRADGVLVAVQTDKDEDLAPLSRQGGRLWASYSSDNGATFSPPAVIASGIDSSYAATLTPDGQSVLLLQTFGDSALLRRAPFAGPDPRVLDVEDTPSTTAAGEITALPDGRMLLIHSTLDNVTGWRVFSGGDPLDINAWPTLGALKDVRGSGLTSGPRRSARSIPSACGGARLVARSRTIRPSTPMHASHRTPAGGCTSWPPTTTSAAAAVSSTPAPGRRAGSAARRCSSTPAPRGACRLAPRPAPPRTGAVSRRGATSPGACGRSRSSRRRGPIARSPGVRTDRPAAGGSKPTG
jgi:hypothetical protein